MEPTIFRFIWRYSRNQQIIILLLTAASYPIIYYTLELPKLIVNEAINGSGFPRTYFGIAFDQIEFLMLLCFGFLGLVLISGWMKYWVNNFSGRVGERMLRRLRYELYARILRFPLPHFKKVSPGELIPMITSEVEPVGGFIGESISTPAMQGGMLMVYLTFIFVQDPFLGLAAVSLYPFQMWLIPKLQRRVNQLAKQRVRTVRSLADRINETVSGVAEIHAHDTARLERADISNRLGRIYEIRYEIFKKKFFIKFLNNFLAQLTPFFFYSAGGYFVIQGDLSFGALVAVLAAYKDLASPWKELLNYYQLREDVRIKYEQVIEQFSPAGMLEADLQKADEEAGTALNGPLAVSNVSLSEDGRVRMVDGVTFSIGLDERVAIVGPGGSGKEELALLIARMLQPTAGTIRFGQINAAELPESVTGRRVTYVPSTPYLFSTSLRDNLLYGLKHRPVHPRERTEAEALAAQKRAADAAMSGNPGDALDDNWVDFEIAGAADAASLQAHAMEVLRHVDMGEDVYAMGLNGAIDPEARPDVAAKVLQARGALRHRLADPAVAPLVEPLDGDRYNTNATMAENLLFGTPVGPAFDMERLAQNPYVLRVLDETGLTPDLLATGRSVAETMLELFSGLPPGHEFFERYSFISADDLPEYQALLNRTARADPEQMRADDRERLLSLPFRLIVARHRLGVTDEGMLERLVQARHAFRANLPPELAGSVEFFEETRYNAASSLQDNVLFGKVAYGQAQARNRVGALVNEVLQELSLRETVMEVGLDFHVGIGGSRLTAAQRQKLGLARALLKRPQLLVVSEGVSALDGSAQPRVIDAVLRESAGRGVIWVLHRASFARKFDRVLVMRLGKVVEQGTVAELDREGTALTELMQAE